MCVCVCVQVGGFRVDSSGRQRGVRAVRYAGSETHLTELLEGVCGQLSSYGLSMDPSTGEERYVRMNTRPGETLTLTSVNLSSGGAGELSAAVRE